MAARRCNGHVLIAKQLLELIDHNQKAFALRNELLAVTWLFATTIGAAILLWNRSFLTLWVGPGNYAGPWVNLLIVCTMAQTAFVRSDAERLL